MRILVSNSSPILVDCRAAAAGLLAQSRVLQKDARSGLTCWKTALGNVGCYVWVLSGEYMVSTSVI